MAAARREHEQQLAVGEQALYWTCPHSARSVFRGIVFGIRFGAGQGEPAPCAEGS